MELQLQRARVVASGCPRGFTLIEMMLVLVILIVLTVVAYPSLRSFAARDEDTGAATQIARLINRVKAKARQRNRAYIVVFTEFSRARPQGLMTIYEGPSSSCRTAQSFFSQGQFDADDIVRTYALGQTPGDNIEWPKEQYVGLYTTVPAHLAQDDSMVAMCISPLGAVLDLDSLLAFETSDAADGVVNVRAGRLVVNIQRYMPSGAGGWSRSGPSRPIIVPFAGPARLGVATEGAGAP